MIITETLATQRHACSADLARAVQVIKAEVHQGDTVGVNDRGESARGIVVDILAIRVLHLPTPCQFSRTPPSLALNLWVSTRRATLVQVVMDGS